MNVNIKMSDNKFCCDICNKKYSKRSSLDKHVLLCEYKSKSTREKQIIVEESSDTPSYDELVKIVQELSTKIIRMEEKMTEMQKYVIKKKKKLNVIDWLNDNVKPTISYSEWSSKGSSYLHLENEHFEYLLNNTLYETMEKVFEFILSGRRDFIYPIICFGQKSGEFYICEKEDGLCKWRKMSIDELSSLFGVLHNNLITEVTNWRRINSENLKHNDAMSMKFNKAIGKLMEMSFSPDAKFNKMKSCLYNLLKTELNLIELE